MKVGDLVKIVRPINRDLQDKLAIVVGHKATIGGNVVMLSIQTDSGLIAAPYHVSRLELVCEGR